MKKKAILFVMITLIMGLIISCQKNKTPHSEEFEKIDAETLSKDEAFNQYVDNFNKLTNYTISNFNKSQRDNIILKIDVAKTRNLTTSEQYSLLTQELKFSDEQTLIYLSKVILSSYKSLQRRFGKNMTKDIFIEAINLKNNNNTLVENMVTSQGIVAESGCGWRYTLCSTSVAFEGGLLLAGCEAITGGVATPLCLVGAVSFAANGIAECEDKYCN